MNLAGQDLNIVVPTRYCNQAFFVTETSGRHLIAHLISFCILLYIYLHSERRWLLLEWKSNLHFTDTCGNTWSWEQVTAMRKVWVAIFRSVPPAYQWRMLLFFTQCLLPYVPWCLTVGDIAVVLASWSETPTLLNELFRARVLSWSHS